MLPACCEVLVIYLVKYSLENREGEDGPIIILMGS